MNAFTLISHFIKHTFVEIYRCLGINALMILENNHNEGLNWLVYENLGV